MKQVSKFKDGKLIKTYSSQMALANELGIDEALVRYYINNSKEYNGFLFKNIKKINEDFLKILVLDIETSPILTYTYQTKKAFIGNEMILRDWSILSYAAKWLGQTEVFSKTAYDYRDEDFDDFELVSDLHLLMDKANIVIAHNGDRFDIKKINTRFLFHGLGPVSPFKSVDTLKISKQNFAFTSNKLDFIAKYLNSEGKMIHEGFELWKKCLQGNKESFDIMQQYNIKDVEILENVYLELRAFDSRHPSVAMLTEDKSFMCTKCGSKNLNYIKDSYTNTKTYRLYKCNDCGGYSRSRTPKNNKEVLMTQ